MHRVAFLTMHDPTGFVIDDELAVLPLARRGIKVETPPRDRRGVDWRQYALVVVRSTWDYPRNPERFLEVLEEIERKGVRLESGSEILLVAPEPALLAAAIAAIGQKLLYARANLVRSDDTFRVMELELVEPSLYLRIDPSAPDRFADAVAALLA